MTTRIALIESHTLLRDSLAIVLASAGYIIVPVTEQHDLLIVDHLPHPIGTTTIVYAATHAIEAAVLALDAGAKGYILKSDSVPELMHGIKEVIAGEIYISHGFANKVIMALRNTALRKTAAEAIKLSAREQQIVKLLFKGHNNKEIGHHLNLSEATIKHYMSILMDKLSARNRLEVVIAAQKLNGDRLAS